MKWYIETPAHIQTANELNPPQTRIRQIRRGIAQRQANVVQERIKYNDPQEKAKLPRGPWLVTLIRVAPRAMMDGDNLITSMKKVRDSVAKGLSDVTGERVDDRDDGPITFRYLQAKRGRDYGLIVEIESDAP